MGTDMSDNPAEGKRLADRIALADLPLFWRGRAKAFRLLDAARNVSIDATLRQAETYDECADELAAALQSQGESSTEPAAWLVCWHRANGDSGLDAYVNEDAARRAAKNLEAYSASETMADVQPLYTAPTPSPAESSTRLIEIIEALIVSAEQNTDDDGNIYPHAARAIADARKFYREGA